MERLLAIDIGGGTQDILVWERGKPLENCIQMVLPSPTQLVAGKIRQATIEKKAIFLHGRLMGGGASTKAVKDHLQEGLPVYATPEASLTIADNPEKIEHLGVILTEEQPEDSVAVRMGDLDLAMLERMLREVGQPMPSHYALAVQDHGFSPHGSNRIFRFHIWEQFMASGGNLSDLAYSKVPDYFTRMQAVQKEAPGALLMDTCGAALIGALTDERVKRAAKEAPVAVVNLGNQHTFAALVQRDRVLGIFEHHTGKMTGSKAQNFLQQFFDGTLTNEAVQNDGGHGCIPPAMPVTPELVVVTGPRRGLLPAQGYYFAAPQGNMMLMGSFGLVAAMLNKEG
jgi:uncharacterized protein (DUF1786 family)